ncbi:MAG: filamentous hemagglutinin N-terminal domain-containing protein [Alphaproteobacteria bacterium]|nr:filamentous hemagglutinin N-terminal domain-containing protein [Alphaproteobacteria bacterium]
MKKRHNIYGFGLGLSLLVLRATGALANPEGGQVAAGQASITSSGSTLTIDQTTDRAVIDWQGFDIAPDEHTEFRQPSDQSFTLNRVRAGGASQIDGRLTANGRIAIVNPQGVYFGRGAQVDVGGLVATTADIDTQDFMENRMNFSSPGATSGRIVNDGYITAREAGLVGLVAPDVENNGVIEARLGRVALASGDHFTLDMTGDGLIQVGVSDSTAQHIVNTGLIRAEGGHVALTAGAARETVDSLIVNRGTIEANSIGSRNGKIILSATGAHHSARSGTSTVLNEGTLSARGDDELEIGGEIHVLGDHVGVMSQGRIDASGHSGGGQVLIGGDFQGGGDVPAARRTYIDSDAYIYARAEEMGDGGRVIVWADDITRYGGHIDVRGGDQSGDGGFIEVSGKEFLDFTGSISADAQNGEMGTLLLDPTDITISNAAGNNINGATPFSPTVDNGPSNLNVGVLQTALAGASVTVQTRATGAQPGNITVVDPISWTANNTLTLDAHNKIFINAAITARNALTLTANDVDINANLIEATGGANLFIQPKTASTTIGIAGEAGTLNLTAVELDRIQAGWNNIFVGSTSGTGIMRVGARTWNAPLTLRTATGEIQINGTQTMGANGLSLTTRNLSLNADLSGTGALTIDPGVAATIGLAGEAGTLNLTTAELNRILNGFSGITIGRAANTLETRVGAYTWQDPLTLRSATGLLNIVGTQTMGANNLTLSTRNLAATGNMTGTGTLTIRPDGNQTVGIAGGAGTFQLTNATLDRITDGWGLIALGLTSNTQATAIGARTWLDPVAYYSGTGVMTVNGAQTMANNNLTFSTLGDVVFNAALTGTNVLAVTQGNDTTTMGVAGAAGTVNLSTSDLGNITNGWTRIDLGRTSNDVALNVNAYTWNDSVRFMSDYGVITVNGNQNLGANNITFLSDVTPVLNADIIGTGTAAFDTSATNTTIGVAGGAGTVNLSNALLSRLVNGWNLISIGKTNSTAALNVNAASWNDSVMFQSGTGVITIAGTQNLGANNLSIRSNGNPAINADLIGTGTLTLDTSSTNTTLGIAGGAGTYNISTAELARIINGWSQVVVGRTDGTGAMAVNAHTWLDNIRFQSNTGAITIAGAQDVGTNSLTLRSNANPVINAGLTGSGTLTLDTATAATTIGLAGGAGTFNLATAELNNITNGWSEIVIGQTGGTGVLTANAYTWLDNIRFQSNTGAITIAGTQDVGTNNLTLRSNGNPVINAGLTGSGTLTLDTATAATTIGLAGGAGTFNLATAELNNITNGWSEIVIGQTGGTGVLTANAHTWSDNVRFQSNTGAITIAGTQDVGTNNLTLRSNGNPAINAGLTGSGTLTFDTVTAGTTIGVAGGAGTYALSSAEIGNITNGWNEIVIGQTSGTGAITMNAQTWADNLRLQSDTGIITIAGVQDVGGNNLTLRSNGNPAINAGLTGSGVLTLDTVSAATTIGLAGGAGTYNLSTAELNNITDGWSEIVVGQASGTGLLSANAHTWSDNLRWLSGTGQINAAGLQNLGGNDLTITTNSNVTGTFQADDAVITTGAGTFTGTTSFTTLNVTGAGATLTPGYIGAPGPATQTMANLIRVGGVLMPTPSPNFTFGTFEIGVPVVSVPVTTTSIPSTVVNQDIVTILRQPQAPSISWGDTFFSASSSSGSGAESGSQGSNSSDTPRGWTFLVDDVLTISPELEAVIIQPGQEISSL